MFNKRRRDANDGNDKGVKTLASVLTDSVVVELPTAVVIAAVLSINLSSDCNSCYDCCDCIELPTKLLLGNQQNQIN